MLAAFASRIKLEQFLEERLSDIKLRIGGSQKPARFDSMFVTDRFGTILAGSFTSDRVSNPIGSNVAFRSYFSGQSRDLDEKTPVVNISRTTSSQVSVPFKSKTTNRNKIAVSTPISVSRPSPPEVDEKSSNDTAEKDKQESEAKGSLEDNKPNEAKELEDEQVIEGLLVLTINVGDFELLSEDDEKDVHDGNSSHKNRFAVLVDGHVGGSEGSGTKGTILQHPIFSKATREEATPYRIDEEMLDTLQKVGTLQYVDPVSMDRQGIEYGGKWIAAMQRVDISRRGSDSRERKQSTDLWVLVQERADSITEPVASMVSSLIREGIFALVVLLTVVSVLWVVVLWVMRLPDSFASAMRSRGSGGTEMTGTANDATLDAER